MGHLTASYLSDIVHGQVYGDAEASVTSLACLVSATQQTLAFAVGEKQRSALERSNAGIVMVPEALIASSAAMATIVVKDAYLAYAKVSALFDTCVRSQEAIHASAVIAPDAVLGDKVVISPNVVIEAGVSIGHGTIVGANCYVGAGTCIGSECVIFPNVTLYHGVILGDRVRVHSSAVVGSDGFGYARAPEGWVKIHQLGGVVVGDDVEIGAGTTIDRGALEDTCIESGVILDNQIQIAHNVHIKRNTAVAACVGIAGSTTIGEDCTIAGGVGIAGHLNISDRVHFSGNTTVTRSVHEPGSYSSGTIIEPTRNWRKNAARFRHLNDLFRRVRQLEKKLP